MKMKYVYQTCPCGALRGVGAEDYNLFKGIPYATAGRWEAPVEVTGWVGEFDATRPGKWCSQYDAFLSERTAVKQFYYNESVEKGAVIKDCIVMQDGYIQTGAELQNVILDKQATVRGNTRMIAPRNYPIVITKNTII